jgi:hypothetical protein
MNTPLSAIAATLGNDINGIASGDHTFCPRVSGYAKQVSEFRKEPGQGRKRPVAPENVDRSRV